MTKVDFVLPQTGIYLNAARMGLLPKATLEAGQQALLARSQPQQITGDDFFAGVEALKKSFARLIDTPDWQRIALIPSVSYGIANAAQNVPWAPGDEVLIADEQFPSNVYPWAVYAAIRRVPAAQLLESIDARTKVVALGTVHWSDGYCPDLVALRARSRAVGALLVLDGTQSVGALPLSVAALEPDALVVAGYKWLLGPYSLGLAYYGPAFDGGRPIEESWMNRLGASQFAGLSQYVSAYEPLARRYDVGEQSNFQLVPMLRTSLDLIQSVTPAAIQSHCRRISEAPLAALQAQGWHLPEQHAYHLFGIHDPSDPTRAARTYEALTAAGVHVSLRGDCLRISPHLYNSEEDMWRVVLGD
ncbi:MAG: aminotransferase class V-fold PLP-dependent enzyme [Bernardetiaceae bacterium]